MGIRQLERSIAKARLKDMGVEHVNKRMGFHMSNAKVSKLMKRKNGRKLLAKVRETDVPVWKRILYGDLAKMYMQEKKRPRRRTAR